MTEETIELREILRILRKRIWIVVLITILATAISGVLSYFFMTPIYQASTQILVNNSKESSNTPLNVNDLRFNLDIIQTYIEVITSPRILDQAIREMKLNLTYQQLKSKINVSTVKQSQLISITVEDPDQHTAAKIANGIASTFQQEIPKIMNVDNVQILAEAKEETNPSPVKPKPVLNMAIAFVVGLMTSIGLIFLIEYLDNTIKNEADVNRYLGLPVLGMVAPIDEKTEQKLKKMNQEIKAGGTIIET
jgi:capsular polysaccharide biosynthesis protein